MGWPAFYDPAAVGTLYLERAADVIEAGRRERDLRGIRPASEDRFRIAALGIDCQVAFCLPGASLFVPGAVEDARRTIEWLYRNLARITTLFFTLDTHSPFQIFHPSAWVDGQGQQPKPFTPITAADVRAGRWIPALRDDDLSDPAAAALEYCERLEARGRYVLTIWPYHALLGGASHALLPAMHEAALFHAAARGCDPRFQIKGRARFTENYSVFSPEVRELQGRQVGAFDTALLDALRRYDRLYVFGQAKSHCVMESLEDLRRATGDDRAALSRIHVLEDAMSPVPRPPLDPLPDTLDFPRIAERALQRFQKAGMRIVRTSDVVGVPDRAR
jgi:nicotinamidase-related amidase